MNNTSERFLYGMVLLALAIQAVLVVVVAEPVGRGLAAVALLVLGVAAWSLRGKLLLSRPAVRALHGHQERLQTTIREKDAELVVANEQLKEEILEQRWTNQALEHQLHYADLIINSFADPICVISKAMRVTRVNASLLRVTGYSGPEVVGQPLERILRAAFERGESEGDPLAAALKTERELAERPAYLVSKGGQISPVNLSLSLLRESGKVVAGVLALRFPPKPMPAPKLPDTNLPYRGSRGTIA